MNKVIIGGIGVVVFGIAAAAAVVVPDRLFRAELDRVLAELPAGTTGRYDDASYGLFSSQATVTGLHVEQTVRGSTDGPAADLSYRLSIDRLDIDDPNTGLGDALQAARENPDALDADAMLPVAGGLLATGFDLAIADPAGPGSGNVVYRIERLALDDVRLYPQALLQADLDGLGPAMASLQQQSEAEDLDAALAQLAPVLKTYAALYLGFGYGPFAIDGVAVTAVTYPGQPTGTAAGAQTMAMQVDRLSGEGFDRGVFRPMYMSGLRQTIDGQVDCRVSGIEMPESSVRGAAERLLVGEPLVRAMLDDIVIGGFEMQDIACTSADSGDVTIDGIAFGGVAFTDGLPTSGEVSLRQLSLAAAVFEGEDPEDALTALGLDRITVSVGVAYAWDMAAGRIALQRVRLAIDELGALEASATLADVPRELEEVAAVTLAGGRIRFTDASLVDRAFAAAAAQEGSEPEAVREQVLTELAPMLLAEGIPPEIVEALATFTREPKTLTLTLAPPEPVLLLALAGAAEMPPAQLITLLGITVTANE